MSLVWKKYCKNIKRVDVISYVFSRLDGKHVVFGSVVEGIDVVKEMESLGSDSGKPKSKIMIANCGKL